MPHFLIPFSDPSRLPAREERQLAREVARVQARGVVLASRECTKVDVIAEVAESALLATSGLAQLEGLLVAQTPHAAGRLQFIAEAAAMGMGAVVQQTARKVL